MTRRAVEALKPKRRSLEAAAAATPPAPDWRDAFTGHAVSVIAEVKRRSPSAGAIAPGLDPATLASTYERGGARAISVLTDEPHFGGSLADLQAVRRAVRLPVLRKDFIVDPVQVFESRAAGASAILLIARALSRAELRDLAALARDVGLGIFVEIHRAEEMDAALSVQPDALGVNSRDLETFVVDVGIVESLLRSLPSGVTGIAESGLKTRADVERAASWGADGVLVGTALASAPNPEAASRNMAGVARVRGVRR